ncbi:restriction endonuclease [Candidatus Poribacteria bacterium]|nr:restriction endonuclease [Candidatus Poribacteria bacterium]
MNNDETIKKDIPKFTDFMNPLVMAMKSLGGSGTIEEINNKILDITLLNDDQLEILHNPNAGSQTEVEYRIAWVRSYLKRYGVLENSRRGVWTLTTKGREIGNLDPKDVQRVVRQQLKSERENTENIDDDSPEEIDEESSWRDKLISIILKIEPSAFERLAKRILRESGFIQVEVTGQSGDGGIDGKGILRLGGLISFNVIFQCKRYSGSVSSSQIRDFRGAMIGKADKGLIITTGNFTRNAMQEAIRDGAPTIDLIDGDKLVDLLKELELGVKTETVEKVIIDSDWFMNI